MTATSELNKVSQDSDNILECLRECLYYELEDKVESSKLLNLNKFLMLEATDYQILSVLFEDKIPDEKSNPEKEKEFLKSLNEAEVEVGKSPYQMTKWKYSKGSGDQGKSKDSDIKPWSKAKMIKNIVVAYLIIKNAKKIYEKYFSSRAIACAKSPEGRAQCLRNTKAKALEERIKAIEGNLNHCNDTRDPNKCKTIVKKEIQKLIMQRRELLSHKW